ncbi:MAG: hypothetical protein K5675_04855 [Lachnospiraceae bacterium]|nr:hypothetical protein [Lachnospiraceae bacterium]
MEREEVVKNLVRMSMAEAPESKERKTLTEAIHAVEKIIELEKWVDTERKVRERDV